MTRDVVTAQGESGPRRAAGLARRTRRKFHADLPRLRETTVPPFGAFAGRHVGWVFVDVSTCGDRADPELAVRLIATALGARTSAPTVLRRGEHPATSGPAEGERQSGCLASG